MIKGYFLLILFVTVLSFDYSNYTFGSNLIVNGDLADPSLNGFVVEEVVNLNGWTCSTNCALFDLCPCISPDIASCSIQALSLDYGNINQVVSQVVFLTEGYYLLSFNWSSICIDNSTSSFHYTFDGEYIL
jgi:hypothetical protein